MFRSGFNNKSDQRRNVIQRTITLFFCVLRKFVLYLTLDHMKYPLSIAHLVTGLLFTGLLVGTGILQTHLKDGPQLFMLALGGLTLLAFYTANSWFSTFLFYLLAGYLLYVNYFMLTDWIIDLTDPDRGWITIDGKRHRVMDMSSVWSVLSGLILAPLTILLYHGTERNRTIEIAVTAAFTIMTLSIYVICEL
jgi:hypothetical protein